MLDNVFLTASNMLSGTINHFFDWVDVDKEGRSSDGVNMKC
jgi:hypothetical protein